MSEVPLVVQGRYALSAEIAAGGMATVHLGRLLGPVGFSRTVAIKRLHPQYAKDPDFVAMFLDEARLAARVQHPNVVPTLDVVAQKGELFLVMEYIEGESLARLLRVARANQALIPPRIVGSIVSGALFGLHAAHEATSESGQRLGIIHRDVSPQNILVGVDGISRVLDFGVAKAAGRSQTTRDGQVKGKLAYMPPEQILGHEIDRRVDIYAAGVVAWESLTCRRLFDGENEGAILERILRGEVLPPSRYAHGVSAAADAVVLRALSRDRDQRFATAWEMAVAIEETLGADSPRHVGAFVETYAHDSLARRAARLKQLESLPTLIEGPHQNGVQHHADHGAVAMPILHRNPTQETTAISATRANRRAKAVIAAVLACGLVGASTLAIVKTRSANEAAREPRAGAPSSTSPAATQPAKPQAEQTNTTPSSDVSSGVASLAQSSTTSDTPGARAPGPLATTTATTTTPRTGVTTTATATSTNKATAPSTTSTTAKPNCDQPYFVEKGIRKIRRECLR
ncbi:MAG: serine/threonine-protein kinase [Polyangiaceae bacterium]